MSSLKCLPQKIIVCLTRIAFFGLPVLIYFTQVEKSNIWFMLGLRFFIWNRIRVILFHGPRVFSYVVLFFSITSFVNMGKHALSVTPRRFGLVHTQRSEHIKTHIRINWSSHTHTHTRTLVHARLHKRTCLLIYSDKYRIFLVKSYRHLTCW